MDELLVQRFKSGDAAAVTAMRNQLRAMAARVLSSPRWEFDTAERQELEREAALQGLNTIAKTAVQYVFVVLRAAGKRAIVRLREREGLRGEGHPDPVVMANVAMGTAKEGQKEVLEEHFEDCPHCRLHYDILEEAIRGATKAQQAAQTVVPVPAPAPTTPQAPRPTSPKPPRPKRRNKGAEAKRRKARRKRRLRAKPKSGGLIPLLILAAAVAAGIWHQLQPTEEQQRWTMAGLLPDELPPASRADKYEGTVKRSIQSAASGDCRSAGNKLHIASKKAPDDLWLHYYEGMAYVCARDGRKAVLALEYVDGMTTDLPWGFTWWLGQAYLLDLQVEQGLVVLDSLGASSHPRAGDARQLAVRVRKTY